MDKIRSNTISNEFEFMIPKFQGLGYKGFKFEGLGPRGLDRIGLEFKSLDLDPSILDSRPDIGGSGPEMFLL
jgi:hypothetical protein